MRALLTQGPCLADQERCLVSDQVAPQREGIGAPDLWRGGRWRQKSLRLQFVSAAPARMAPTEPRSSPSWPIPVFLSWILVRVFLKVRISRLYQRKRNRQGAGVLGQPLPLKAFGCSCQAQTLARHRSFLSYYSRRWLRDRTGSAITGSKPRSQLLAVKKCRQVDLGPLDTAAAEVTWSKAIRRSSE